MTTYGDWAQGTLNGREFVMSGRVPLPHHDLFVSRLQRMFMSRYGRDIERTWEGHRKDMERTWKGNGKDMGRI